MRKFGKSVARMLSLKDFDGFVVLVHGSMNTRRGYPTR